MRVFPVYAVLALAVLVPITAAAEQSVGNAGAATVDGSYIWVDLGGGSHYCPPDCGENSNDVRDKEAGARAKLRLEANNQVLMRDELSLINDLLRNFRCPGNNGVYEVLATSRSKRASTLEMASFNRNAARINGAIPGGATLAGLMRQLADEQERTAGLILQIAQSAEAYVAEMDRCGSGSRAPTRSASERAADEARPPEEERARREREAEAERLAAAERQRQALELSRARIGNILDDLASDVTAGLEQRSAVAPVPASAPPAPLEFVDSGTRSFSPGDQDSAPVSLGFLEADDIVVDPLAARGSEPPAETILDPSFKTNVLLDALEFGNQNWETSITYLEEALLAEPDLQKQQAIWDALNYTTGIYAQVLVEEQTLQDSDLLLLFDDVLFGISELEREERDRVGERIRQYQFEWAAVDSGLELLYSDYPSLRPTPEEEMQAYRESQELRDGDILLLFDDALGSEPSGELNTSGGNGDATLTFDVDAIEARIRDTSESLAKWIESLEVVRKIYESRESLGSGDYESAFNSIGAAYKLSPGTLALREALGYAAGLSASAKAQDEIPANSVFTDEQWERISDMMVDQMIERLDIIDEPEQGAVR